MAIARTLFAVAIALSVAWMPVAGATVSAPAEISTSDGDHDCCPKAVQPCDMTKDGCMSMVICGLLSSTLSEPIILEIEFPLIATGVIPPPASDALDSHASGPPLHPPQG